MPLITEIWANINNRTILHRQQTWSWTSANSTKPGLWFG